MRVFVAEVDIYAYLSTGPEVLYEYDLFAVINHEGQIDNGHYTNFARLHDEVSLVPTIVSDSLFLR